MLDYDFCARVEDTMLNSGWFTQDGCYTLFDGQYGSTGKGLLASVIAKTMGHYIDTVATNAGPNSGHTAYWEKPSTGPLGEYEKVMTQQIPVASAMLAKMDHEHLCYLNGGAVIEPAILADEIKRFCNTSTNLAVHPHAAVIHGHHQGDQLSHIASTGKGVGPAMASKLGRTKDAVISGATTGPDMTFIQDYLEEGEGCDMGKVGPNRLGICFVETAQGWSLGINSGFYPYTTSRECSVAQALADMQVPPTMHQKSIVSLRCHPIRVGNTPDGYSGDVYPDQKELSWDELAQTPEKTTVTQRVRRVFSWSWAQFADMLRHNRPDALFINFVNYLPEDQQAPFIVDLVSAYRQTMGHRPDFVLAGFGPYDHDVRLVVDHKGNLKL